MTQVISPSLASWLALDNNDVAKAAAISYFQGIETLLARSREVLTANRTYYVRTDGSNSNTGLANTSGGAFLTIQKAIDTIIQNLDVAGKTVTIQVADGTYTSTCAIGFWVGGGAISIVGNTSTPANCKINTTSADCFSTSGLLPGRVTISGFQLKTTTSGAGINHSAVGEVRIDNIDLNGIPSGTFTGGISVSGTGALLIVTAGLKVSGSMPAWLVLLTGGRVQFFSQTVTLTGTPNFDWVGVVAKGLAYLIVSSITFSGSATGSRYSSELNSIIDTGSAGASYLPGNSAGSTSAGGQYI